MLLSLPMLNPRRAVLWVFLTCSWLLLPVSSKGASFPPSLHFRSLSTARVTVHYPRELAAMAREAAAMATEILERHEARYGVHVGRVQVVLTDVDDDANGFATPLPYPMVSIRAVPPDGSDEFGNYEGWLRLVLTHELAHVVHLDEAHGVLGAGRKVLGRAPYLFPNGATPTWTIEGLATYEETEGTSFGRGRNPDSRMVLRMAALEGRFPAEDRPVLGLDEWPSGQTSYLFGEAFFRYLSTTFGDNTLPAIARVHSGRAFPFLDDRTSSEVTGRSFHDRWKEWAAVVRIDSESESERLQARGLTESHALTTRGVRQIAPRFSPDGDWIAYTSRRLTRLREIRLIHPDGTGDHRLTDRNGGAGLAWTPDGRTLVFDETEVRRFFTSRSDLRTVDVRTGRRRWLTRGMRAHDPDVSPDGRRVVFVRRLEDRAELCTIGLDGRDLRVVTRSEPTTEWSHPRWSPQGDRVVASRWTSGGLLDLVLVDGTTGAATPLTNDRAKDVEPAWTPDGSHVIFRSDRDGVSNLHALRIEDGELLRVTNVLGGAFTPDVSRDGRRVAFASYTSRGYDVHIMDLALRSLPPADFFVDTYPLPRPPVEPVATADRPYRPFPTLLPRFWSPFATDVSGETQFGVLTAGADPLFRHIYGLDVQGGAETKRVGFHGFYQYDRFFPTVLVSAEDTTEPEEDNRFRTRSFTVRATVPLQRTLRASQAFSLSWRRERQETLDEPRERLDLGGLEAAWSLSTAKLYPLSISPQDGWRLRLAWLREARALGSEVSLSKLTADARAYVRVFGESDVLALRAGGGATIGQPGFKRSFAVGGFPDGGLFDLVATNFTVLRGYPDNAFTGRRFAHGNVEYRIPLGHPQRGFRSWPFFLRHLHAAMFFDAAHAWSGEFRARDVKTGAGAALGADIFLFHGIPITATAGVAQGFADKGETRGYFRVGLAF